VETGRADALLEEDAPETAGAWLPLRTICESGATVASPSFPPPGGAGAPEFGLVCVASSNVHMHRDVIASSFGDGELTAALLLHHELEHVGGPRPDC
jgi:hypothetical protein